MGAAWAAAGRALSSLHPEPSSALSPRLPAPAPRCPAPPRSCPRLSWPRMPCPQLLCPPPSAAGCGLSLSLSRLRCAAPNPNPPPTCRSLGPACPPAPPASSPARTWSKPRTCPQGSGPARCGEERKGKEAGESRGGEGYAHRAVSAAHACMMQRGTSKAALGRERGAGGAESLARPAQISAGAAPLAQRSCPLPSPPSTAQQPTRAVRPRRLAHKPHPPASRAGGPPTSTPHPPRSRAGAPPHRSRLAPPDLLDDLLQLRPRHANLTEQRLPKPRVIRHRRHQLLHAHILPGRGMDGWDGWMGWMDGWREGGSRSWRGGREAVGKGREQRLAGGGG